ncbi:MAG: hypothetical protein MUD01_24585 [Chloroflexaceae bacterium]|jgi:hypothetical protein|nr:hypothetical protein [Chloroflexaceae bacterium]
MFAANVSAEQQALLWEHGAAGPASSGGELFQIYRRAQLRAQLLGWWARLRGRGRGLLSLAEAQATHGVAGVHAAGLQSVPLSQICGSENRSYDFDQAFLPLHSRSWERWRSVAQALQNNTPLPPVELVQLGGCYYVRDGHHRISAAALLGQQAIDAVVTVWEAAVGGV